MSPEPIRFTAWPDIITVTYTNWKGITATRRIRPHSLRFGSTEWHPEPQWLMKAEDIEKNELREFALKDMTPEATP